MRNIKFTIGLLVLLFTVKGLEAQSVRGNGHVIKIDRPVSAFDAIVASNGWDLILTQGTGHAMTIEADENLVDALLTEVRNGVLYISSDVRITKSTTRMIYLTFEELNRLKASGGVDVEAKQTLTTHDFSLELSGGSDLTFNDLSVDDFECRSSGGSDVDINFASVDQIDIEVTGGSDVDLNGLSAQKGTLMLGGGSDVYLSGEIDELKIIAGGGSDIDANQLNVQRCTMKLSGASDADIRVSDQLDLILSGASDATVIGNPEIVHRSVCRSCDLEVR